MKKPSPSELSKARIRFRRGDRPWPDRSVDWFIVAEDGVLYPLKYIYALATDQRPASYTTNQAKAAMRHLGLPYLSLKAQSQSAAEFEAAVAASLRDVDGRQARLKRARRTPVQYVVSQLVYARDPDVVAEVLDQAKGFCGLCGKPAPFVRRSDGTPYLEVHHRVMLSQGGEDTVENAVAACPNCHRAAHHG